MNILSRIDENGEKVFAFLGEAGSGKSEIAVNWALMLAAAGRQVRFFDMDQTKPLFRSRELNKLFRQFNVMFEKQDQLLDAPVIPHGVFDKIKEADSFIILDIGGNAGGARAVGQFAEAWGKKTAAYLVVNCYRPFSGRQCDLSQTMDSIVLAARLQNVKVISNPNFGGQTQLEDVVEGHKYLEGILEGSKYKPEILTVSEALRTEAQREFPHIGVMGIERYIKTPWDKINET